MRLGEVEVALLPEPGTGTGTNFRLLAINFNVTPRTRTFSKHSISHNNRNHSLSAYDRNKTPKPLRRHRLAKHSHQPQRFEVSIASPFETPRIRNFFVRSSASFASDFSRVRRSRTLPYSSDTQLLQQFFSTELAG